MSLIISLFLSTFILEDVALGSALVFISQGQIDFLIAFFVCSLGIGLGDLGLYLLGRFASKISYFQKKTETTQFKKILQTLEKNNKIDIAIVVSRAIPGTRIPTYFAAGVMQYSLSKFILLTIASVSAWVFTALYFGQAFFSFFNGQWIWAFISFFIVLSLIKKMFFLFNENWSYKAAMYSWRRWLHFEFWPAWFFYLPIVPYYLFLSVKHRSLLVPFYASPHLKHGGLIGESKWDFLKYLSPESKSTLPAFVIEKNSTQLELRNKLKTNEITFPFIAKPNIGQRGFGVRVIKNDEDLLNYLELSEGQISDNQLIIQQKSQYSSEAGVFYIRHPSVKSGFIFSITDKKFPFVIGNGHSTLGDLILNDKRARIIASTYFARHKNFLNQIIPNQEKYVLSDCGNHCQGALFFDGSHLSTPKLLAAVENIVSQVPDFYFGRIDIRYKDEESLKQGLHFEIIEINGAGSEATHIWDPKTKILNAYRTLFKQWQHLFSIGDAVKRQGRSKKPELFIFIFDCLKVFFRKGPLTTSS
jgi:membrane protein DedA with SNARE-associated domain